MPRPIHIKVAYVWEYNRVPVMQLRLSDQNRYTTGDQPCTTRHDIQVEPVALWVKRKEIHIELGKK